VPALSLQLTPHGRLVLAEDVDAPPLAGEIAARLTAAFADGSGPGLFQLGAAEVGTLLPAALGFWRDLAARHVTAVCTSSEPTAAIAPPLAELAELARAAPPMTGGEYVTADVLAALWAELGAALRAAHADSGQTLEDFLHAKSPAWNLVGRVHFNLAENRRDEEAPFAFLATYTARLASGTKAQHMPLGEALKEYASASRKDALLSLLLPVQRAAKTSPWLAAMVESGEVFHPLRWTPADAIQLLNDLPSLEAAGVIVRVPGTWNARRPPAPQVSATVGKKPPAQLGQDALLDFSVDVTLDGEPLTAAEIERLLGASHGLHLLRGRWVEVDGARLTRMLDQFRQAERAAAGGLPFVEAMRLLAGAPITADGVAAADPTWSRTIAGPWLATTLAALRNPEADPVAGDELHATLRPYQQVGVRWLHTLATLGLGACLADDMGLGKTIQVIGLLLALRKQAAASTPSLLVVPASLIANWTAELARFAPSLRAVVAHSSAMDADERKAGPALAGVDLVITTYGSLGRLPWLPTTHWRLVILDEAQAIKNPGARQTRAVRDLRAGTKIALTGTPVENRLGDLWSIFDVINPGLLGNRKQFTAFTKGLADRPHNPFAPLRDLVRPYILRRLKTDRAVITDLPDKTEIKAYCPLSRRQAALYQDAVKELTAQLGASAGMKRKGMILSYLMRFKQICNHPSQWLGDGSWAEADSGKLARLREITEVIAARQEKVLVFTQFRETTAPLADFLAGVFGRAGLVLHGGTTVPQRKELVKRFQADDDVPFFVLSLKAGGAGLNLTAASHVVHFDRWWNPAVENQATDRAFRIGQQKNVMVHKLVCRGTVEDKIDQLIESKRALVTDLLGSEGGGEVLLTEMADDEIARLVALDLRAAAQEA
jgi:superfamily II DNA or RNA helicase